ncbi:hypothetical protein ABZP36_007891 [Zizania latifolia]
MMTHHRYKSSVGHEVMLHVVHGMGGFSILWIATGLCPWSTKGSILVDEGSAEKEEMQLRVTRGDLQGVMVGVADKGTYHSRRQLEPWPSCHGACAGLKTRHGALGPMRRWQLEQASGTEGGRALDLEGLGQGVKELEDEGEPRS